MNSLDIVGLSRRFPVDSRPVYFRNPGTLRFRLVIE